MLSGERPREGLAGLGDPPVVESTPGQEVRSLTERLAAGDEAALAQLYDAYAGRAFGLAYRVTGDRGAAEDVVHDAFLWTWEHASRFDPARGEAGSLLLTITHRRAIDVVRRRRRIDGRSSPGRELDLEDESALAILSTVESADVRRKVRDGLRALNPDQREVIELAYFEGMTQGEIAERQEIPLGTVKSRIRLGLQRLRSILGPEDER